MKYLLSVVVGFITIMIMVQCKGSSHIDTLSIESKIEQKIKMFFKYFNENNNDKVSEMLTKHLREQLGAEANSIRPICIPKDYPSDVGFILDEIDKITVMSPDCAEVIITNIISITVSGKSIPEVRKTKIQFVLEGNDWYINGIYPTINEDIVNGQKELTVEDIINIGRFGSEKDIFILKKAIETNKNASIKEWAIYACKELQGRFPSLNEIIFPIVIKVLKEEKSKAIILQTLETLRYMGIKKASIPLTIPYLTGKSDHLKGMAEITLSGLTPLYTRDVDGGYGDIYFWKQKLSEVKTDEERQILEGKISEKKKQLEINGLKTRGIYEKWWQENKDYLYWDAKSLKFKIDEEAKNIRISIDPHTRKSLSDKDIKQWRDEEKAIIELEPILMQNVEEAAKEE